MPAVKSNPVPIGRYWSDLIGLEKMAIWNEWRNVMNTKTPGAVKVQKVESHLAEGDQPEREWVLYETTVPTLYDHTSWPPMNIADASVVDEASTVTKPDPEDLSIVPDFSSIGKSVNRGLTILAWTVGALGLGAIVFQTVKSSRRR